MKNTYNYGFLFEKNAINPRGISYHVSFMVITKDLTQTMCWVFQRKSYKTYFYRPRVTQTRAILGLHSSDDMFVSRHKKNVILYVVRRGGSF